MITIHVNRLSRVLLIAVIALLAVNIHPGEAVQLSLQSLPAPAVDPTDMGTAFTYQGRLMDGANPANGSYDFIFDLYDDATAGTLIGTDTLDDHAVVNGLFMADLDFGAGAFTGFERWLEIGVRAGSLEGSDPYTTLSPRQPINPTPYATFARTIYRKTVVVKPVGTASQNGTELLNALAGITDANIENTYLIKLEPGVYHIGGNSLQMKSYVDIEGSGENLTRIESDGFSGIINATVIGASGSQLRFLTVRCDADQIEPYATALVNNYSTLSMVHTRLEAVNGVEANYGMRNLNSSSPWLESVFVLSQSTSGGVYAILNDNSSLTLTDSDLFAGGAEDVKAIEDIHNSIINISGSTIRAMDIAGSAYSVKAIELYSGTFAEINHSQIESTNFGITGDAFGIYATGTNTLEITDSVLNVSNGSFYNMGIKLNMIEDFHLFNSKVHVLGGSTYNVGIQTASTRIDISQTDVKTNGGQFSIGLWLGASNQEGHQIIQNRIQATGAIPTGSTAPESNANIAIITQDASDYLFANDIILTETEIPNNGLVEGGVGIYNELADITLENSTINNAQAPAYQGIVHKYATTGQMNFLRVDNSEIYTCIEEGPNCKSISTVRTSGSYLAMAFAMITSSLLSGGAVTEAFPITSCLWVTDENMLGFGWPDLDGPGPLTASNICP